MHELIYALYISLTMLAVMHVEFAVSVYSADSGRSGRPRGLRASAAGCRSRQGGQGECACCAGRVIFVNLVRLHATVFHIRVCANVQVPVQTPSVYIAPPIVVYLFILGWMAFCDCCSMSRTQNEETSLIRAAVHGRIDCVRMLIDAGADKEAKSTVRAPIQNDTIKIIFYFLASLFHFLYIFKFRTWDFMKCHVCDA